MILNYYFLFRPSLQNLNLNNVLEVLLVAGVQFLLTKLAYEYQRKIQSKNYYRFIKIFNVSTKKNNELQKFELQLHKRQNDQNDVFRSCDIIFNVFFSKMRLSIYMDPAGYFFFLNFWQRELFQQNVTYKFSKFSWQRDQMYFYKTCR